jgi:hypothetical protein
VSTPLPRSSGADEAAPIEASIRTLTGRGVTASIGPRRLGVFPRTVLAIFALSDLAVAEGVTLIVAVREKGRKTYYLTCAPDGTQVRSAPPASTRRNRRDLGKGSDPTAAAEWLEDQMWGSGA